VSPASRAASASATPGCSVSFRPQARREAVGLEGAAHAAEDREGLVALPAGGQHAGEREGGVGAAGLELERAAQGVLVALGDQPVGLVRGRAWRRSARRPWGRPRPRTRRPPRRPRRP
jgi:hypothetical protein